MRIQPKFKIDNCFMFKNELFSIKVIWLFDKIRKRNEYIFENCFEVIFVKLLKSKYKWLILKLENELFSIKYIWLFDNDNVK